MGIAVFQTTAYQCLVQMALIAGGTGRVVMAAYTMPFWVALFAWMLLGDRPTRRHWVGFVLAAAGLLAVVSPWKGLGGIGSSLLALGGGMAWALGTVLGIAYLGVLASAVAWGLWMLVVRRVAPTVAGMSGLGVPVLAVIMAWVVLGERPAPIESAGIALMLAGLVVVTLAPARRA